MIPKKSGLPEEEKESTKSGQKDESQLLTAHLQEEVRKLQSKLQSKDQIIKEIKRESESGEDVTKSTRLMQLLQKDQE